MSIPVYDSGIASGLLAGILFGYVLEAAGFGSPRKLTAQFRLSDFSVFKVMFTAVLVAAVGLWILRSTGVITQASVYTPTTFFWAMGLGGVLIGAGFAIGGYCPGTSIVGAASGRIDAFVFMAGILGGSALFGWAYEPLQDLYFAAQGPKAETLPDLFGVPEWIVLAALIAAAAAGFAVGNILEKARGGPLSAKEVMRDPEEIASSTIHHTAKELNAHA